MTMRTMVQCTTCSRVYSARITDGRAVLPTDDGDCTCGSKRFFEVADPALSRKWTAR